MAYLTKEDLEKVNSISSYNRWDVLEERVLRIWFSRIKAKPLTGAIAENPQSRKINSAPKKSFYLYHHKNLNNMTFFEKLKQEANALLTKLGIIKAQVKTYIATAITFSENIQALLPKLEDPATEVIITDLIGSKDEAILEDFAAAIPKAIPYLTQAAEVISQMDPNEMLRLFLESIKTDTPAMQKTKIGALIVQIVAEMDDNRQLPVIYRWLITHYEAVEKMGISI